VFAQLEGVSILKERPFSLSMRKAHETLNQCQKQNGWYKYDVSVSPRFRRCKSRNVQKERRVVQAWTGRGD